MIVGLLLQEMNRALMLKLYKTLPKTSPLTVK